MKIVAVIGSPRRGNCWEMARVLADEMERLGDVDFQYLWLRPEAVQTCSGCTLCVTRGEEHCPLDDQTRVWAEAVAQADALVLLSPVYVMQVSGLMKNFIDRLVYWVHRPPLRGTPVLVGATAAGAGQRPVIRYLSQVATYWGGQVTARVSVRGPDILAPEAAAKEREKMGRAARRLYHRAASGKIAPVPVSALLWFRLWQAVMSQAVFGESKGEVNPDREYWEQRGWLHPGCHYFYPAPLGPGKRALGRLAGWVLRQLMRRMTR